MEAITAIGLAAGLCTTVAFLPQVIKCWRTRSTRDISLVMFLVLCTGITLWVVYGILTRDLPLIAANGATLVLAACILAMKVRYG